MDQVARRLASTYEFNRNRTARLVPLREELTGQVEDSLIVLYIAVGVLLAIACFNIANLLIARAASRRQEIAIRTSLGAARGALVRQLLVESMLLALVGGALGIVLARSSLDALVAFAPPRLLGVPEVTLDARVLLYVAGLSVLTGLVAGLAPSVIVARRSIVGVTAREQLARHAFAAHPPGACRRASGHDRRAALRGCAARANGDRTYQREPRLRAAWAPDNAGLAARHALSHRAPGRVSTGAPDDDSRAARSGFGSRRQADCR